MRLSLAFSGFGPLAGSVDAVRAAEDVGLDGVWTAEHLGHHDAIVPSAMYLQATERVEIGMVGFSGASGDPGLVGQLGGSVERPLLRTRQFVDSLRTLLSGRELNTELLPGTFKNYRL